MDKTYGDRESIRLFIKDYELSVGKLENDSVINTNFNYSDVQGRLFYLNEPSFEAAVKTIKDASFIQLDQHVLEALSYGVLLGKLKRKRSEDQQYRDVSRNLSNRFPGLRFPRLCRTTNALAKQNSNDEVQKFSKGDTCIIGGTGQHAGEFWYARINYFILVSIHRSYHVFLDSEFFIPVIQNNTPIINPWTETHVLEEVHFARERLQLSSQIVRKVILYPVQDRQYVPVDFEKPPSVIPVPIPYYPKVGDHVSVRGPNKVTWYAKVLEKDCVNRTAKVKWYNTNDDHHLRVSSQTDEIRYRSIIEKVNVRRGPHGYELVRS